MCCVAVIFALLGLRKLCLTNSGTDKEETKSYIEIDGSNTVRYNIDSENKYEIVIEPGSDNLSISVIEVE